MCRSGWLRPLLLLLTCCTMAAACVTTSQPVSAAKHFDPGYCLQTASGTSPQDESRCPGFMSAGLKDAMAQCRGVGGILTAASTADVFSIDVNSDGRAEYLYEFNANFGCDGAASYFSCGSAPCPWTLYMHTDSGWQAIGEIFEGPNIEPLQRTGQLSFRDLRVACDRTDACDNVLYGWDGSGYRQIRRTLRGYSIELPLLGNLWTPARNINVLAEARDDSPSLGEYDQNGIFVILGAVPGTDYICVSPCRACATGFVHRREVPQTLLR